MIGNGILQIIDGDDMEHELDQVDIIILEFSRANVEAGPMPETCSRRAVFAVPAEMMTSRRARTSIGVPPRWVW